MKIQIMSDLHFEYHRDGGVEFINSLDPNGIDALILAGDIGERQSLRKPIELMCSKYPKVFFVPGNHEYYGSNKKSVLDNINDISKDNPNFHPLDNEIVEIGGRRLLGTTLWYSYVDPATSFMWSDFQHILNLSDWIFEENKKSINFLIDNLKENDIVVSHFLPSHKCIAPKYINSQTNMFFVTNVEELIKERSPAMWIHGHTHVHVDLKIGKTRIIANPRGYIMFDERLDETGFDNNLKVDI